MPQTQCVILILSLSVCVCIEKGLCYVCLSIETNKIRCFNPATAPMKHLPQPIALPHSLISFPDRTRFTQPHLAVCTRPMCWRCNKSADTDLNNNNNNIQTNRFLFDEPASFVLALAHRTNVFYITIYRIIIQNGNAMLCSHSHSYACWIVRASLFPIAKAVLAQRMWRTILYLNTKNCIWVAQFGNKTSAWVNTYTHM